MDEGVIRRLKVELRETTGPQGFFFSLYGYQVPWFMNVTKYELLALSGMLPRDAKSSSSQQKIWPPVCMARYTQDWSR